MEQNIRFMLDDVSSSDTLEIKGIYRTKVPADALIVVMVRDCPDDVRKCDLIQAVIERTVDVPGLSSVIPVNYYLIDVLDRRTESGVSGGVPFTLIKSEGEVDLSGAVKLFGNDVEDVAVSVQPPVLHLHRGGPSKRPQPMPEGGFSFGAPLGSTKASRGPSCTLL